MAISSSGDGCTPVPAGADCVALCKFKHLDPQGGIIHMYWHNPIPTAIPDTVTLSPGEEFQVIPNLWDCSGISTQGTFLNIYRDDVLWGTCQPSSTVMLTEPGYYTFTWEWISGVEFFDNAHHYYLRHAAVPPPVIGSDFTVSTISGRVDLSSTGPSTVAATLFHISGALVQSWTNLPVSTEPKPLPIPVNVAGAYLLVIENEGGRSVHKLWLE